MARAGASSSAAAFRMNAGIESGPVAFWVLSFFKSLWTPFQSTLISACLALYVFSAVTANCLAGLTYSHFLHGTGLPFAVICIYFCLFWY